MIHNSEQDLKRRRIVKSDEMSICNKNHIKCLKDNNLCCLCKDNRPKQEIFERFVRFIGVIENGMRYEDYCASCKNFLIKELDVKLFISQIVRDYHSIVSFMTVPVDKYYKQKSVLYEKYLNWLILKRQCDYEFFDYKTFLNVLDSTFPDYKDSELLCVMFDSK